MGKQANFFLHPDDQADFDSFLKSLGDIVILPYYHFDNKVSMVEDTIIRDLKKEGYKVYLIRREDLKNISLHHIERLSYWLIDTSNAPLIEFSRCVMRENKLMRGRLYFQPQYMENQEWIKKSDDFISWADKVISTTRRRLNTYKEFKGKYNYTYYFGENAKLWFEKNNAEISRSGDSLIIKNKI